MGVLRRHLTYECVSLLIGRRLWSLLRKMTPVFVTVKLVKVLVEYFGKSLPCRLCIQESWKQKASQKTLLQLMIIFQSTSPFLKDRGYFIIVNNFFVYYSFCLLKTKTRL